MSTPDAKKSAVAQARNEWFYATKPTRMTVFMRTFLPWQAWRFVAINLKMISMIRRSHKGQTG
jgi:hypothetical protein